MTFTEIATRVAELGLADRQLIEEYYKQHPYPVDEDGFVRASDLPEPPPPSPELITLKRFLSKLSVATQYMLVAVYYIGQEKCAGKPLLDEYDSTIETFHNSALAIDHILGKHRFPEHIATGLRLIAEDGFDIDEFMGPSEPVRK